MKTKSLFAAVLCAALLITGCNGNEIGSGDSSYNSSSFTDSDSSGESSSSSSTTSSSSSSTSSSSSSSSTTSSTKPKPVVPKATFDTGSVSVNQDGQYMTVPFKTNVSFDPNTKYYLRIYFSDTGNSIGELRWDEEFDTSSKSLNLKLHNGMNYYTIQFYSNEAVGDYSNTVSCQFTPVIKHNTFEFYTMTGAMYGEAFEVLFGYPDYNEVDRLLAQGITPEYINVEVYYRCPYCRTETYCGNHKYSYTKGEAWPFSAKCSNKSCSHRESAGYFLSSHIN